MATLLMSATHAQNLVRGRLTLNVVLCPGISAVPAPFAGHLTAGKSLARQRAGDAVVSLNLVIS